MGHLLKRQSANRAERCFKVQRRFNFNLHLREILGKKQFCSKSQADVCVKLCPRFKVDNCLPIFNAGCFAQVVLGFQISCAAMFTFAKFDGDYDVKHSWTVLKDKIA